MSATIAIHMIGNVLLIVLLRKEIKLLKTKYLKWWDIVIITLIMLGPAIMNSTQIFMQGPPQQENLIFTTQDDIRAIVIQSVQLAVAFVYLWLRKFEFRQWQFKITLRHTLLGIGLFFLLGFMMDLVSFTTSGVAWIPEFLTENTPVIGALAAVTPSVVAFSLLNGFYEEIFFLGVCTSVEEKYQKYAFIYAILIRVSFHTYQGIPSALGIGLFLGVMYYVLYRKKTQNLYPYMLSHTFADIFGLSLLNFL